MPPRFHATLFAALVLLAPQPVCAGEGLAVFWTDTSGHGVLEAMGQSVERGAARGLSGEVAVLAPGSAQVLRFEDGFPAGEARIRLLPHTKAYLLPLRVRDTQFLSTPFGPLPMRPHPGPVRTRILVLDEGNAWVGCLVLGGGAAGDGRAPAPVTLRFGEVLETLAESGLEVASAGAQVRLQEAPPENPLPCCRCF